MHVYTHTCIIRKYGRQFINNLPILVSGKERRNTYPEKQRTFGSKKNQISFYPIALPRNHILGPWWFHTFGDNKIDIF